ncbi:extracellular solute-binding protein [Roseisalinus antarcticus]|uniref:Putative D,D-dipeptide-binding periplasmic protein DdpA n=1 Tax=Roseisalinus antarcticus TaxID=254357 RepID=A0A1Y5RRJ2_9RHOB|nr:extracellular solute-binding protein [Roseisalinus antarcticus]SLN22614.1 putative D,D-dipeptide-binding periplasmic protein DdpA precursor [Roseisalinus antarcticus]
MRPSHPPQVAALAAARDADARRLALLGGSLLVVGTLWGTVAFGEAHEEVTTSYGYTNFGELKYPADFEHLDYVNPDAPKGGEIAVWTQGTFDSFNNYARQGVAASLSTIGSEAILTSTADDPYGLYCYLCTTLEYPDDLSWIVFNLRDDVTFANGTPMTAEDVAFSYNIFIEQGIAEYRNVAEGFVESVEVEGPHRIKFIFQDDAPRRDRVSFAGGTPVFSKTWFEEGGIRLDESTEEPFMATGQYVLDSFDYNRQIIYRSNPDYWGADVPFNVGRGNFESIRVEYFADSSAAFEAFKAGEYTFRIENSSRQWATGYDFPALDNGWAVTEELFDGTVGTRQAFVFNLDREQWQDESVRRAVELMFNFEWSNRTLFYDLYARPESYWSNTDLAASGTPSEAELAILQPLVDEGLLDAEILTAEAVMPPVNDPEENAPSRGVFRAAAALLEDAGYAIGDDGYYAKDGQTLEVVFLQVSPQFDRIVNPYIENLERLGIKGVLERVDFAQYVERRRSGDFDLTNHGFDMGFEPGTGLEQWYASKTADDSSRNVMRLRNEAVDRILPLIVQAETLEELNTSTQALDRVLRSIGFDVPQWFNDQHWVAYYDMYRHPENMPPLTLGHLDFWWYDADRAAELRAAGAFQ